MRDQFMVSIAFLTTEAIAASDQAIGAWLRLCAYSAPRLLGGKIAGAKGWDSATWSRVAGMKRQAAEAVVSAGLATWAGDDLVLNGYDLHGEVVWRNKSTGGKKGNATRWGGMEKEGDRTPTQSASQNPDRRSVALRSDLSSSAVAEEGESLSRSSGAEPTEREANLFKALKSLNCAVLLKDPTKWSIERAKWLRKTATRTIAEVVEIIEASSPRIEWASEFPELDADGAGDESNAPRKARRQHSDEGRPQVGALASWITSWKSTLRKYRDRLPEWWASGQLESLAKGIPDHLRADVLAACPDPRNEVATA